jgi:hypothetical protein
MSKYVLGVSLGASLGRDFDVTIEFLGEIVHIRRLGTDGNLQQYIDLLKANDGKVDAIGFGGFDLWLWCNGRKYIWREPNRFLKYVKQTPVLDGSGLKNSLERLTIQYLQKHRIVDFSHSNTLLVCAVDRFGMAEAIWDQGGPVIYGDLMFALGIPIPIRSLPIMQTIARILLPLIVQLPIKWLYPTGDKQEEIRPKFGEQYAWADVICGDAHYIRRHMPDDLSGKIIITNTTTVKDIDLFKTRGVKLIITTTPSLGGRTPGTNIFEAMIVAVLGINPAILTTADYKTALAQFGWEPNIIEL